jgi:3-hydroxy-9,10-secoandrosta-1,3,5(10)-triene-9,17-dione monooxygenase reductase component
MRTAAATTRPAGPAIADADLRAAFGRFATGVAFVTAEVDGAPLGLIVSSFAAVSLEPPLVSFCPGRDSFTWRRMRAAGRFTVSIVAERHAAFARRAAARDADRFAGAAAVLRDAPATIECELAAEHAAGDHWIAIGRVVDVRTAAGDPLVYFAGAFGAFHPH